MGSNDELKETDIENGTYYYFVDIMSFFFFFLIFDFSILKNTMSPAKNINIALNGLYNTRSSVTCEKF